MRHHLKWTVSLLLAFACVAAPWAAQGQTEHASSGARHAEYMVVLRDGVKLATSVYLPEGEGPWPAILSRTPYGKDGRAGSAPNPNRGKRYTDEGYAYIIQDVRGKYRSEGDYVPHEPEQEDGYDTVEWVAAQDWCNGKVGLTGGSALGITANLASAADPPHLVCAFVRVAPRSLFYETRFVGGVFREADTGNWMRNQGVSDEEIRLYQKRVVLDERWEKTDLIFHRHNIDIPIYNSGGWYDLFLYGNVKNFQYLQNFGREGAQGNQRLMMGPIGHGRVRGDIEYPNNRPKTNEEMRFFDYWMKGIDEGFTNEEPVKYYMMAAARKGRASEKNGWRTAETWPPQGSRRVKFYLHEGTKLSTEAPAESDSNTAYRFDPRDPVKTVGGLNLTLPLGPMDQREIGERSDYLRFETGVLAEDVAIAGKIDLELFAATDGLDTDFVAKLVDVYPDGYEALVLDTALRTRYRKGRRAQNVEMMTPGEPEKMTIDMWHSAITFEKGHKIALHLTSSNNPRYEVNPNTGEAPGESKMTPRIATNTIYHDSLRPTALILPVLDE